MARKLPEQLAKYHPVLGTSKQSNIETFQRIYGESSSADPETILDDYIPEPRELDPSVAARFKSSRIMQGYQDEAGRKIAAIGSDVVFVNGSRHLKPDTRIHTEEELIVEAIEWYCSDSFIVHWLIAVAIETEDGLNRIAVLDVEGKYLEPLQELDVRKTFNDRINARIPLVEAGREGTTEFSLSNSHHEEKVPISQELAEQLVVDRVLPLALMNSLLEDEGIGFEDENDKVWDFVILDLLNNIDSQGNIKRSKIDQVKQLIEDFKDKVNGWKNELRTRVQSWRNKLNFKNWIPRL
jgi:hypothetical protein